MISSEQSHGLDLGVIGNCVISALVDRNGRMVWSCYPRFDSDPVFCSLVDGKNPEAGFMDVELDGCVGVDQHYVRNTAILCTVLIDKAGRRLEIADFAPRFSHYERTFRPPMLVRRITALDGACRIRIRIRPKANYGAVSRKAVQGANHVRYTSRSNAIRITTDIPVSYVAEEHWFILETTGALVLGPDETLPGSLPELIRSYYDRTRDYWWEWVRYLSVPFEWQDAVIRAAIALKLCNFEESGGIVAAMTTSIPEAPSTARNWDYRYCWLRDAHFVVHALNRLGATRTMEDFIRFMTNVVGNEMDGRIKPVYGILPSAPMPERLAPHLAGYLGFKPVRIGNEAQAQIQNDSYGSVVLATMQMFVDRRLPREGDAELFHRLEPLGEEAIRVAFEPDASLWEYRGRRCIHTYSSVMCWVACDRLAKIAQILKLADRQEYWRVRAAAIRDEILKRAWNAELNSFTDSFEGKNIDASLLLLQEVGFVGPSDPRFLGTLDHIEKRLRHGNHLFRYAGDDFGTPTTSFIVCTFWYIDALVAVGRRDEAREIFEHILTCRNHLGLLSEDIDPKTGLLWGNFPQTYSMVGLMVSAMRLSKSWEEAFWHSS
jgi:GH15 family glucan-1,4-alpha-glucosidase